MTRTDQHFPSTIPTLTSERLKLRAPVHADAPAMADMVGTRDFARMTALVPHPYHEYFANGWISCMSGRVARGEGLTWLVTDHETGTVMALIGLSRCITLGEWDLSYGCHRDFEGQGVVTEGAKLVIDWTQAALGARAIRAIHATDNPGSGRVLEKLGFVRVGREFDHFSLARGAKAPCWGYVWPADMADKATPFHA